MGRRLQHPRYTVKSQRYSEAEAQMIAQVRGDLSDGEFIRHAALAEAKRLQESSAVFAELADCKIR